MNHEDFDRLINQHQAIAVGKRFIPPELPSLVAVKTNDAYKKGCSRNMTAFGRTQSLGAWAREMGKARETITRRIKTMPLEEALTKPSMTWKKAK